MPQIDIGGYNLHYLQGQADQNNGSLIFIHGAGGDGTIWNNLLSHLPSGFTGIAADLPGHNRSEGDPFASVNAYTEVIIRLITVLNLPRPLIVVGHSMGGAIALQLALTRPDLIDGLIMVGSSARLRVLPQFLEQLSKGVIDGDFLGLGFAAQTPDSIKKEFLAQAAQVPVTTFFKDFSACSQFDVRDQLAQLKAPLLLLVGDEDKLTPPKLSKSICDNTANSEMIILPQAGHFAMLEQPQLISEAIEKFVSNT